MPLCLGVGRIDNRGALILRYRAPAVHWINEADPCSDDTGITQTDVNRERTVYLISDEDADGPEAAQKWLKLNYGDADASCTATFDLMTPGFTKRFAPHTIAAGGISRLTFTIDNTGNSVSVGDLHFDDYFPVGLGIATPSNANTTCTGGTITAMPGTGGISYTGGARRQSRGQRPWRQSRRCLERRLSGREGGRRDPRRGRRGGGLDP